MNPATQLSPYSALSLLLLFKQRRLNMTEEQYDQCVDTLIAVLEDLNDERYRLENRRIITPES